MSVLAVQNISTFGNVRNNSVTSQHGGFEISPSRFNWKFSVCIFSSLPSLLCPSISNTTTKAALKKCCAGYCGKWRRNVCLGGVLHSIHTSVLLVFSSAFSSLIYYISRENLCFRLWKNSETFYRYPSCLVRNLAMGRAFGGPAALCFVNQFVRPNAIALN